MAVSGTPDHDSVHTIALKRLCSLLWGGYVSVSDDRDMHPRILLHLSDQGPVRLALVHLAAGASVDGQRPDSHILQPLGQLHDDLRVLVPAKPGLHRHRKLHRLHDLSGDLHHLVRLPHHSRTGSAAGDLAHRTSEVDVHEVCSVPSGNLRSPFRHDSRIHHRLRDISVYLDSDRSLIVVCHELFERLAGIADESVRGDELRVHHVRSELLADETEGCVGHILHRSQKKRLFTQFYITYLHIACKNSRFFVDLRSLKQKDYDKDTDHRHPHLGR